MGCLFLVRDDGKRPTGPLIARARVQLGKQGFADLSEHALPGWRLLHGAPIKGGPMSLIERPAGLVAVAGTPLVGGKLGEQALAALLVGPSLPQFDWSIISGHFAAARSTSAGTQVFADYLGMFPIYHDVDHLIFSTSYLAIVDALPRVSFDTQAVYEWAFNIRPVGEATVLADVRRLAPGAVVELGAHSAVLHETPRPLPSIDPRTSVAEQLAVSRDRLMTIIEAHVAAFGDNIHCPLSGGMDSRLVLAALRTAGARPKVYVYGGPASADVTIARAIGAAEGFAIEVIDKSTYVAPPNASPAQVEGAFHEMDGLPSYAGIFDVGGNRAAREARHAGGGLAVSGGGGEVFRDFFHLPDRPTSALTVARTFFARFDARDATEAFDGKTFLRTIARTIAAALSSDDPSERLPRDLIEQAYPRIRCRALFGHEIGLEAAQGAYLMPLLDRRVVATAMGLPLGWKRAGRFEAALIEAIDPALARHPSAYGHHFAQSPSMRHRFGDWQTRVRPALLRQHSYAIQRRLRPMTDEHGSAPTLALLADVIDPELPIMRQFFRPERITDAGLWRRLACLEYFAEWLGSKLA